MATPDTDLRTETNSLSKRVELSVVLVVRDGEQRIARRIHTVLDAIAELGITSMELVVVDDGSRDATPQILDQIRSECTSLRVIKHSRPRGMEAAGQSGLERTSGELVIVQEADSEVRLDDFYRLYKLSQDGSIVAARAESAARPIAGQLIRRLRALGSDADHRIDLRGDSGLRSSLQMIRRSHLHRLSAPDGNRYRLEGETYHATTIERQTIVAPTEPEVSTEPSQLLGSA